jgi:hypothetical protein
LLLVEGKLIRVAQGIKEKERIHNMGNRAVITLAKKPTQNSVGIYLHWNGGAESVLAFAEAAKHLGVRLHDETYATARLAQIIGNFFGGTLSVGVGVLKHLDCENYDNGTYKVWFDYEAVVIEQSKDGKKNWKRLNNDELRKHAHWQETEESKGILADIMEKNKRAFQCEEVAK